MPRKKKSEVEVKNTGTDLEVAKYIKGELDIQREPLDFKVPLTDVFSKTNLATKDSFGGNTFVENIEKVDNALAKTDELLNIWNHSHSQWIWRHINLSYHDPYRNMRQVSAEINSKKMAMNDAKWRQVQNEVRLRKIEEKLAQPELLDKWQEIDLQIKLAQMREGFAEGAVMIEGAMKDILALTDLYEQLKKKVSDFDEEDIEENETLSHLRRSLVQCIRDVRERGSITKGEQEYMEQIGVNPMKIQRVIREYVALEETSDDWSTEGLTEFVEDTVQQLKHVYKVDEKRMKMMGFKNEYTPGISHDKKVAITDVPPTEDLLPVFKFDDVKNGD